MSSPTLPPYSNLTTLRALSGFVAFAAIGWLTFDLPPAHLLLLLAAPFVILMLLPSPRHTRRRRLAGVVVFAALLALCYYAPSDRARFLRSLYRVQPGMTEAEVRRIMADYMQGTGWPAVPPSPAGAPASLHDAGSGATYEATATPSGELALQGAVVFRYSTTENDWGIVTFEKGRVSKVSFSPD